MEVVFELVVVKPALPYIDARVLHDRGPVRSKPVCDLGAPNPGHDRPNIREKAGENASQEGVLLSAAARKKPGTLNVIVSFFDDRLC